MKYSNPPNSLKEKVGSGGIPAERIERAETVIAESKAEFSTYIQQAVKDLAQVSTISLDDDIWAEREDYTKIVMSMKAHGKMFGYPLVTALSYEVLQVLDVCEKFNADMLDILLAYKQSLKLIADNKMVQMNADGAKDIVEALCAACGRYLQKYSF